MSRVSFLVSSQCRVGVVRSLVWLACALAARVVGGRSDGLGRPSPSCPPFVSLVPLVPFTSRIDALRALRRRCVSLVDLMRCRVPRASAACRPVASDIMAKKKDGLPPVPSFLPTGQVSKE